jgi:hypothetical protein
MLYNFTSAPLHGLVAILSRTHSVKTGIVRAKSAVKPVTSSSRIQDYGTDKRRGRVAVFSHDHGKVREVLRQRNLGPHHFVELRIRPRQYGCVRRRGKRNLRVSTGKDHTL